MAEFLYKPFIRDNWLRNQIRGIFSISFSIFLFILFFQPFPINLIQPDNKLLFITLFGGITFVMHFIFLIIIPQAMPQHFKFDKTEREPADFLVLLIWVFTSVAYTFYLRYVGKTPLTFYIVFKILLINAFPVIALRINYTLKSLMRKNDYLKAKLDEKNNSPDTNPVDMQDTISFISDNKADVLRLSVMDVLLIKSAENYIEVLWCENEVVKRQLIRNTLKNIELLLESYTNFVRCHRTSIINMSQVAGSNVRQGQLILKLNHLKEEIPVSRQYLIKVREYLEFEAV